MSAANGEFILGQYRIGNRISIQVTPSVREPLAKSASEYIFQQAKK